MLNIPFYQNQGYRCAQTAIKSVLKAISPKRDFSLKYLDEITERKEKQITWPCQIAYGLGKLGKNFDYFVKSGFENLTIEAIELRAKLEYPEVIYKNSNFTAIEDSINYLRQSKKFTATPARPSLVDLDCLLKKDEVPILLVNWDIVLGRVDTKKGHYLIVTQIGEKNVYAHDSGPHEAMPDRKFCKEVLNSAWQLNLFDWGLVTCRI